MAELSPLIQDLALILVCAAIVTLVFKRLKQPVVLGYIVAGFLVSPHMPYIMSVVDKADVHTWADIGVMFLLFSLGLEFSFKKILRMGIAPVIASLFIVCSMSALGYCSGHLFGWSHMDSLFLGGMLAMSSTTIIYKAFDDLGLRQQKFASVVMSVLILEDILAIVMMVMLSAIAGGSNPDGMQMLGSVFKIGFFLILWFVVGIFAVPAFLRHFRAHLGAETLLVVSLGLCCLMAVLSTKVGFSSAFGAFVMGSILAETVEAERIERLIEPVKNLFGAVFFVSVGMLVDPQVIVDYALPIAVLVLTILVGQAVLGSAGFFLSGQSLKASIRCGFSMAQIGEFAFIIASLGLSLGVISNFLYPIVVAVSVITTFLTPYMMRYSVVVYDAVEHRLPNSLILQLNSLHANMPEMEKSESNTVQTMSRVWRRLLKAMALNTLIYAILSAAVTAVMLSAVLLFVRTLLPHWWANAVTGLLNVVAIAPFLRAIVVKKNHSEEWKYLWQASAINRLPLLSTIIARMAVCMAFLFYICNYLARFADAIVLCLAFVVVVAIVLSREVKKRSIRMERMFRDNLRSRDVVAQVKGRRRPYFAERLLDYDIHLADVLLPEDSSWAGMTLSQLQLGNRYGVSISSILRGNRRINTPGGDEILFPGDSLQVIGTDAQIAKVAVDVAEAVIPDDPDFEKREMQLSQILISRTSPFLGKTLATSMIRQRYHLMVVGLENGEAELSVPSAEYVFRYGDVVWVVGERDHINAVKNL